MQTLTAKVIIAFLVVAPAFATADGAAYNTHCAACHQASGTGVPGAFPPLAGSDYLVADPTRAIDIVLHGMSGPVEVSGTVYNGVMPPMAYLSNEDVAAALNHALNSWGNDAGTVTPQQVAERRRKGGPVKGEDG